MDGVSEYRESDDDALSLESVNKRLEGSECLLQVVAVDACREPTPTLRIGAKGGAVPRGFKTMEPVLEAVARSVLAFACAPEKLSFEPHDPEASNGFFTAALLNHLETDGAQVEDVSKYATIDCISAAQAENKQQCPWKLANCLTETHVCLF